MTDRRTHLQDRELYKKFYEALGQHSRFALMYPQEPRLRWAMQNLGPDDDCIDIGCDKGHMTVAFRDKTRGRVVGVDIAECSIAANQANAMLAGCEWVCAEAERLPFPDHSFDVAFLCEILEHVIDPMACIAEAERIVRPGGKVVISVPVQAEDLERRGSGAEDIRKTGYELDGHVRDFIPEVELQHKPGIQCMFGMVHPQNSLPFYWRLSSHTTPL